MPMKILLLALALQAQDELQGMFLVTGYCNCRRCCGQCADGKTATGKKAKWGVVAADWRVLPKHSRIRIDGLKKVFRVEDRGAAIKGKRIDIWFPSHKQALRFGVSRKRVWLKKGRSAWDLLAIVGR